jgi:hypothetical protein
MQEEQTIEAVNEVATSQNDQINKEDSKKEEQQDTKPEEKK